MYYIYLFKIKRKLKPFLEHIDTGEKSSLKVKSYTQQLIDVPLHYHPEHEIVYVQKGQGKLLLADFEESFGQGDLFFIKGSIPHLFEDEYLRTGNKLLSKVVVMQYNQLLFENLYHLPEFYGLKRLETASGYGIKLKATAAMRKLIVELETHAGLQRFNKLLALLHKIIQHKESVLLGSPGSGAGQTHIAYLRLQKMHGFLARNFSQDCTIDKMAALMHMSKTSFCRFLKRETDRTFSEHLNFYRIHHASNLLGHSSESVMQICYSCGFNNAAYFFRQFKKAKKVSPLEYRRSFQKEITTTK